MKQCAFGMGILVFFAFGAAFSPIAAFAQTNQMSEEAQIQELQGIINQLLLLIGELQKQLVILLQTRTSAVPGCGQAEIAWGRVSGAKEYALYRNGIEVYRGKERNFVDTGLMPGATYTYTVRAKNDGGLGAASPVETVTISSQCPPAPPFAWAREASCGGNVQIAWSRVSGDTFYEVYRDDKRMFGGNTTFFIDRGLRTEREYSYKVRAGNVGGFGDFGREIKTKSSAQCPPDAPKEIEVGTPLLEEDFAQEGRFIVTLNSSPSGITIQSGKSGENILSFRARADVSPVVVRSMSVDFSDRAWLFLSEVHIRDGSRQVAVQQAVESAFSRVGDTSYRMSFPGLNIEIAEGRSKTIFVHVVAKEDLLLAEPREIQVSIPQNSVRATDQLNIPHEEPEDIFAKLFFVKRVEIKP